MYYVQRYRPEFEAISKEVQLLARHFAEKNKVRIHDLHLDGILKWEWNRRKISYHFLYYPLLFPFTKHLSRSSDINHIYTSLGDRPYLKMLQPDKTILTAAASCHERKIKRRLKSLKQLRMIIVETEYHQKLLQSLGINPEKIKLIYPPVDLASFSYTPASGKFKILYASCPTRTEDFEKRGIDLLIDFAEQNGSTDILLAWRSGAVRKMQDILSQKKIKNMLIKNEIVKNMNTEYAQAHATIIPYTQFDDFLKLIPNSALESLAAGKPLLVSSKTELAAMVKKYRCGVVFEPNPHDLQKAVQELQKNYNAYQQNCRKIAEKLFSKEIFLEKYKDLYQKTSAPKL